MPKLTPREKAELALSVNARGTERPLSPIEAAEKIAMLKQDLGSESEVARALGLKGTDMVRRFLSLLTLPQTVTALVGWEGPKEGKLSLDMAYRISTLESQAVKDALAKAVVNYMSERPITKNEVQSVVTLCRMNPQITVEDCFEQVLKVRPKTEIGYLLLVQLSTDTVSAIVGMAAMENVSPESVIGRILLEIIPSAEMRSVRLKQNLLYITLTEEGRTIFKDKSKTLGVRPESLLDHLVDCSRKVNS